MFSNVRPVDEIAENILRKRYYMPEETSWEDVARRVADHVLGQSDPLYPEIYQMIANRYFIPNSPTLVNSGKENGGLSACFVISMEDSIEDIYQTKFDFARIARKGGGCGTTLSNVRPQGDKVSGSAHGYAGGPIAFFDTISHDMDAITQAGFRPMAMMATMSVTHPDILKFISAKTTEGKIANANMSVVVTDEFMRAVEEGTTYWTEFNGVRYQELNAREVFRQITDGAWRNGEPGMLFYEKMNNSPYKFTGQEILATNPCGEQPLPPNGVCNLGSLDVSKFLTSTGTLDVYKLRRAAKLATYFLDRVIDRSSFPTEKITEWAKNNRPVGLGIMGFADFLLVKKIAYGSEESLKELDRLMNIIYDGAIETSIRMGELEGAPVECQKLPQPRKNITLISIAPTGTISLLAGCSSGIEPIFSEITVRVDNTGRYDMHHPMFEEEWFRCAVSANGAKEVTWREHLAIQSMAQRWTDSGVSKTINCPTHTRRDTVSDIYMQAWKDPFIKGITIYRNQSRQVEVLTPKNVKKDKCPVCGSDLVREAGCKHCSECDFSVCEIG